MEHKHGDSFDYVTTIPSAFPDGHFVGWTTAAQVRDKRSGALVATLTPTWVDPATTRDLRLLAVNTSTWPLGLLEFDIQFTRTSDSYVSSTPTQAFSVVQDVTRP